MLAATDRLEFAPPATPGLLRALILAVLAHCLLVLALTWGVHWKRDAQILSAEAELWSAVPQEAAPKLVELPPEPPAPLTPEPAPPAPEPEPPAPKQPEVDIALQQEKLRLKKQHQLELARQEELKLEKLKQEKLKQEKLKQEKQKQDKLKLEQEQADKAKKEALEKKATELDAKQLEAQRQKNLQRMTGMAGATGAANSTGTALKSSGPSASYAGRIRARIKPNIVFTEEIQGNPTTEVEVHTSPDGTIIASKITKSSGLKSWDEAVLKAIDKTAMLPRDLDGSVPSSFVLIFRPRD
jgi:colicin import membrane protein